MKKEELKNFIKKYSSEMLFKISDDELEFFVKSVDSYLGESDSNIKNFDIDKWDKYNFDPEQKFSGLYREDIICKDDSNKVLNNSINFEKGYVVVKNEK